MDSFFVNRRESYENWFGEIIFQEKSKVFGNCVIVHWVVHCFQGRFSVLTKTTGEGVG